MPDETGSFSFSAFEETNPPVEINSSGDNLSVTFPGQSGSGGMTVTIPVPDNIQPVSLFDANFPGGVVVSIPGSGIDSVTIPGTPPVDLSGTDTYIDFPNGGGLTVQIPTPHNRGEVPKIKVTLKKGDSARILTQIASV